MSTYTGTLPSFIADNPVPAGDLDELAAALHALNDPWTAYTPTWASSGTQPDVGNGTLVGKYARIGKLIVFKAQLTMGSGTTFGTGVYTLSLPAMSAATFQQIVPAKCRDASATSAGHYPAIGEIPPSQAVVNFFNVTSQVSNANPFTWASGDYLAVSGMYEAA